MTTNSIYRNLCTVKDEIPFNFLGTEDFERIACFFESVTYPAGTRIFSEGDPADFMGFVMSGKLEVRKQTEFKGNQVIIALLTRGALVGELSFFTEHMRSASVETVEDTTLLILRNAAFDNLIREYPDIGIKLLKGFIRTLALRLRRTTDRLTSLF